MSIKKHLIGFALVAIIGGPAIAQEVTQNVIYLGAGAALGEDLELDDVPYSVGFLNMSDTRNTVFGFDFAGEGEMFDSTGGGNRVRQALSFNLLIGGNIQKSADVRTDAMLLIGARETVSDCPDSFLGFQCYADQDPDTEYDFNVGGMVTATFDGFAVGARVTTESAQLTLGLQF